MDLVRFVLIAAVAVQAALLVGVWMSHRWVRSRSVRRAMASGGLLTALVTVAALASQWADRTYAASDYALGVVTLAFSVAAAAGAVSLVRYVRVQQTRDDELEEAAGRIRQDRCDLALSSDFYLQLFDGFPAMIWRAGTSAQRDFFNRAWLKYRGRTLEEESGEGWTAGVHPDDLDRSMAIWRGAFEKRRPADMEYRLLDAAGEYHWIADHSRPFLGTTGEFLGYIGSCRDITVSKDQASQLAYLADHDTLTGLANRRVLQASLERAFVRAQRDVPSILLSIDVDHFKAINDRLGHPAGDALLIAVSRLLVEGVRGTDVVARLAGDEFGVLLEMIDTDEAVAIAQRLVDDAREHLSETGLSIGVASMADATDITEVMHRAYGCMLEARNGGGSQVAVDHRAADRARGEYRGDGPEPQEAS